LLCRPARDHNRGAPEERVVQITTRQVLDVTVADVSGRMDSASAGYAYDELVKLAQSGITKLLLNLEQVDFLSSAGMRSILVAAKLLRGSHGMLQICGAKDVVRHALELSGFTSLLPMHDSETEAVRSF
jgi:anti-anti-sigma factor